jgi:hypothetical protein
MKNVVDIDSLNIQEEKEEVFTFLSGSGKQQHQYIKLTTQMNTALIFKEQAKVKELELRERA